MSDLTACRQPGCAGTIADGYWVWLQGNNVGDVFAWMPQAAGKFRVWVSWGSGYRSHDQDARYVLDLGDAGFQVADRGTGAALAMLGTAHRAHDDVTRRRVEPDRLDGVVENRDLVDLHPHASFLPITVTQFMKKAARVRLCCFRVALVSANRADAGAAVVDLQHLVAGVGVKINRQQRGHVGVVLGLADRLLRQVRVT